MRPPRPMAFYAVRAPTERNTAVVISRTMIVNDWVVLTSTVRELAAVDERNLVVDAMLQHQFDADEAKNHGASVRQIKGWRSTQAVDPEGWRRIAANAVARRTQHKRRFGVRPRKCFGIRSFTK